jgi:hypothetical protein
MYFDETGLKWINPSPNMRYLDAAIVYPGLGSLEATNISWSMTIDGGFIFLGKQTTGKIQRIPPRGNVTVTSKLILGFGDIKVTTIAEIEENIDEKTNNGFAYVLYIQINPSG